jgi:rhodanese-related sulfurtransferase
MKTITPLDLQRLLQSEPVLALLDVRSPVEFFEVHVPQAKNIPLDEIIPKIVKNPAEYPKSKPLYLLCRGGQRAAKAAIALENEGYEQVSVIEGGTLAWVASNLPVERGTGSVISLERQVRIVAGAMVFSSVVLGWYMNHAFFLLTGFVGAGLVLPGSLISAEWECYWQRCLGTSASETTSVRKISIYICTHSSLKIRQCSEVTVDFH